ncbi:MAG: PilZ domain-containing protein [Candidatus Hodarchaeales archaeon]|jgi:exoribonuclease II
MLNRFSGRMNVDLETEIIFNNTSYEAKIENVSEEGLLIRIYPEHGSVDFYPGTIIKLKLEIPSGEKVSIDCNVVWSKKDVLDAVTNNLGLQVLEIPPQYNEFVKTLFTSHMGIF